MLVSAALKSAITFSCGVSSHRTSSGRATASNVLSRSAVETKLTFSLDVVFCGVSPATVLGVDSVDVGRAGCDPSGVWAINQDDCNPSANTKVSWRVNMLVLEFGIGLRFLSLPCGYTSHYNAFIFGILVIGA